MQSKKMSLVESLVSTAIGYSVATAANYFILPLFGHKVTLADASWIGVIFTGISLVRGYLVRRLFNWVHVKQYTKYYAKLMGIPVPTTKTLTELRNDLQKNGLL